MALTVLSIAHPLAAVTPHAVGGAEQILSALDRALLQAGHRSVVIGCAGSKVAGELLELPTIAPPYDGHAIAAALAAARLMADQALRRMPVDVIHIHALHFASVLPESSRAPAIPTLVTLHLPRDFYGRRAFHAPRAALWFNCVSAAQHCTFDDVGAALLNPIPNAAAIEAPADVAREDFALVLTRICWEKGIHLAIEAACRARTPLRIAGQVFPYRAHQAYFEQHIAPRLDAQCSFIGAVHGERKRQLLSSARCVLVPSLVPETSSLVAREALSCGTPVVAFDTGALREIVVHGSNGFLVRNVAAMAAAVCACERLDHDKIRAQAREQFSLSGMTSRYVALYQALASSRVGRTAVASSSAIAAQAGSGDGR